MKPAETCPKCGPVGSDYSGTGGFFLVGNPNVGKSTLVNALAGSRLAVGNWSGTTTEKLSATLTVAGQSLDLIDLPGAYALEATSPEEAIAQNEILANPEATFINVVDSGNLERNLLLTIELAEFDYSMVMALNLWDEAKAKGLELEPKVLAEAFGIPVIPTVASSRQGTSELLAAAQKAPRPRIKLSYHPAIEAAISELAAFIDHPAQRAVALLALNGEPVNLQPGGAEVLAGQLERLANLGLDPFLSISETRYAYAQELAQKAIHASSNEASRSEKTDRLILKPWLGVPAFLLTMFLVFRATFLFSGPWVDFIGALQEVVAGWAHALPLPVLASSLLADGLVGGVGTVLSFVPVLFILYLFMGLLENSGILARAALLADRAMALAKLPGRGFIPMILGFGCNVPAIYAARALEDPRDRLRLSLVIPFMSCSARLAVFTLFAAVFFPNNGALVVFGLYLGGIVLALLTAAVLARFTGQGETSGVMEIPPYRWPALSFILKLAGMRTWDFVRSAGGIILIVVVAVWALQQFPAGPLDQSLYAQAASLLIPIFAPLGIESWELVGALIPGFIAKEVVIGTLGVSYLGQDPTAALGLGAGLAQIATSLGQALTATLAAIPALFGAPQFLGAPDGPSGLQKALAASLTPSAALAYMVFVLLYTPCVATIGALKQEFGTRWAAFTVIYGLAVAYMLAFLVSRI